MELKNNFRKINDPKKRLRVVLTSLQPEVNKSGFAEKKVYISSN